MHMVFIRFTIIGSVMFLKYYSEPDDSCTHLLVKTVDIVTNCCCCRRRHPPFWVYTMSPSFLALHDTTWMDFLESQAAWSALIPKYLVCPGNNAHIFGILFLETRNCKGHQVVVFYSIQQFLASKHSSLLLLVGEQLRQIS